MRRAAEHLAELSAGLRLRVVYADLDGTLLGPGGSLFATRQGGSTLRPAEAVRVLLDAGVDLVPLSGRTVEQVHEVARLLGTQSFIAELGGVASFEGQLVHHRGAFAGPGTPVQAMVRSGAAAVLLEAFEGRLEPHTPWAFIAREASMLFRGSVDLGEVRVLLNRAGYDWLDLHDNGIIPRSFPGLRIDEVHAYHLVPAGVSKAAAAGADLARRGLGPEAAVAFGDAPSDAALAPHVGAVFVVANGRRAVEAGGSWPDNVFVTDGSHGDGFAEVILALLGDSAEPPGRR